MTEQLRRPTGPSLVAVTARRINPDTPERWLCESIWNLPWTPEHAALYEARS